MTDDEIKMTVRRLRSAANAFGPVTGRVFADAADLIERQQVQLAESRRREQAANEELDVLHEWLGGELPKHCKDCDLWGEAGWGQFEIGYCEGDDNPHKATDFCSRWSGPEAGKGEKK
ncbi:MAG: hypothetical protein VB078_07015 [Clostridiaceae bacterium]|nr:hypothetical protein [Clostridiaceae bacterium]